MAENKWRLFQSVRRQEIDGLSAQEAGKIVGEAPTNELEYWFAWRPGLAAWVKAVDCPEIQIIQKPTAEIPPPPPPAPTLKTTPVQAQAPTETAAPSNRRAHERLKIRLAVIIVSHTRTFRTHTKDVSMGGIKLEKNLPWKTPVEDCAVFISSPETQDHIEFRARVIADSQNPNRIAFDSGDEKFKSKLFDWIAAMQSKQAKAA